MFNTNQNRMINQGNYNNRFPLGQVHLISSDLWEAITGERSLPSTICEICDNSFYQNDFPHHQTSLYINAKDKIGSRNLQQNLETCSPSERNEIFQSLFPYFIELSQDPTGNYVIQKLCEFATDDQQEKMLNIFISNPNFTDYPNGCRVLQKFLENSTIERVDKVYFSLHTNIISLCFSQNGNHIIQRFVEKLPNRVSEIVESIAPYTTKLVVDNCGCRVVQKLFDIYKIDQLTPLVEHILLTAPNLANDQYGNYVIQNIIQNGSPKDIETLLTSFKGHFYDFSIHKFASNVIEKCIQKATSEQRNSIFEEIIGSDGNFKEERIFELIGDQFGNYVIQRILEFGTEEQCIAIFNVVDQNYEEFCTKTYAKHVITRLKNLDFDFNCYY